MRKIRNKIKTNAGVVVDVPKQQELETKFINLFTEMGLIKQDIGKNIFELQKKEQEFAKAHKQILEQMQESYHTLDWISNLLLETAGHKPSESNNGLNPIIVDIKKRTGVGNNGN